MAEQFRNAQQIMRCTALECAVQLVKDESEVLKRKEHILSIAKDFEKWISEGG